MDNDLEHKVSVVVGVFVLVSLATSLFYGWQPIIVCGVGLFLVAAVLRALRIGH